MLCMHDQHSTDSGYSKTMGVMSALDHTSIAILLGSDGGTVLGWGGTNLALQYIHTRMTPTPMALQHAILHGDL